LRWLRDDCGEWRQIIDGRRLTPAELLLNVLVEMDAERFDTQRHEHNAGAKVYRPEK
jgi:hypothetical protein